MSNEQAAEVRSELHRILTSPVFEKAKRSQRFVTYLVEAALSDPPLAVKEYALAMDVFDQPARYDPNVDATVRVEAGRLRSRLREYYTGIGREAGVVIDLPEGGYSLAFSFRTGGTAVNAEDATARVINVPRTTPAEGLIDGPGQLRGESMDRSSRMPSRERSEPEQGLSEQLIPERGIQHGVPEMRDGLLPSQTAPSRSSRRSKPLLLTVSSICVAATLFVLLVKEETTLRRAKADLRVEAAAHAEVTVTPLTALQGMKFAPTFSPDGSQVAFAWDGGRTELVSPYDLYSKVIGYEQLRQLTHNPGSWVIPAWSPDGRNIAFVRDGKDNSGVFLISALGGPERKLAGSDVEFFLPLNLSWSRDGRTLAYATRDGMHTVDVESGEVRSIPAPSACPATYDPAFSPDGRWLAFSCYLYENYDLYVLPLGGGAARRLTRVSEIPQPIAWTNDSKRILYEQFEQLHEVSIDGGSPHPLAFARNSHYPAIAATGERLAFVALSRNVNLWRVNLKPPGRESVSIMAATSAEQVGPDISPDGKRICFASSRSGPHEIWVSNVDGSDAVQLTHFNAEDIESQWSPDGKLLGIQAVKSGISSLFTVDPQVGVLHQIQTGRFTTGYVKWSRDGRSLYFINDQPGTVAGTYKVSIGGGAPQLVSPHRYCSAQEARSGDLLYYMNGPTHAQIYERDLSTQAERRVDGMPEISTASDWALASDGIYFIDLSGKTASIGFFDFRARRVTHRIPLPRPPVFFGGLALAPDESWLAYSQVDRNDSSLMLAEGFR